MHMNDFKISWVAWLGSLTKPSKVERSALRPPRYYGRLVITASFFGKTAIHFLVKKKTLVNTVSH